MHGIHRRIINNKEITILDFSDCKEQEMISRIQQLFEIIEKENRPILLLVIFNNRSYLTPNFMRKVEHLGKNYMHLVEKQAVIGISGVKKWILAGYNLIVNRNIPAFDSEQEAFAFLVDDKTTDKRR